MNGVPPAQGRQDARESGAYPFCLRSQNKPVEIEPQYWIPLRLRFSAVQMMISFGAGRSSLTAFSVAVTSLALRRLFAVTGLLPSQRRMLPSAIARKRSTR